MRFLLNEDSNHFIISRKGEHIDEAVLRAFILQYAKTGVTDLVFNVNCRVSAVPSAVLDDVIDVYRSAVANNHTLTSAEDVAYDLFEKQKIDMYAIWFETARKIGIKPWLSFRMNDCHCSFTDDVNGAFYQDNPAYRRAAYRRQTSSFDCCYDYAHEIVRTRMKDYIAETLARYDADGIELDFMREATCFQPGHEDAAVITTLLQEIKEIVRVAEGRYGHKIELSVTLPTTPEAAYNLGFAALDWMRLSLVDLIIPISRWGTIDNDIPVNLWKEWLYPFTPQVIAGHQILLRSCNAAPVSINSFETAVGSAATYYGAGSDGAYLYNYMDRIGPFLCESTGWGTDLADPDVLTRLLCVLGDKKAVMQSSRRHVITFSDSKEYWKTNGAVLPLNCHQNDYYFPFRIGVGDIPKTAKVHLILAVSSENTTFTPADIEVYVSGHPCTFESNCAIETHCSQKQGYCFVVEDGTDIGQFALVELTSIHEKAFATDYVEIYISNAV